MVNQSMSKYSIITIDEVYSTNGYALENMPYFEDKTIIYTTNQTSGRGRYNRKWVSDTSENIYMTIVLKPKVDNNYPFSNLTQYLSVILAKFLEKEYDLKPQIKWPNDILVCDGKISGILAETYMNNSKIEGIALGLGLNVNMREETLKNIDQKAVSLYSLTGKTFNCQDIVNKLTNDFFENYDEFISQGFKYIKNDYISRSMFLGKLITIKESNEKKQYYAQSIEDDGFLIVKDELNNVSKIITGDLLC